jgi:hypothetical protein
VFCFVFDRVLNLEKWKILFSQSACLDNHSPSRMSGGFARPVLPSQGSSCLVARRIHPVFSKSFELLFPEKVPTFLAILPSSVMEAANAVVFLLELARPPPR